MRRLFRLGSLATFIVTGCVAALNSGMTSNEAAGPNHCRFDAPPVVLMERGSANEKGSELLQIWETSNDPDLWKPPVRSKARKLFEAEVRARVNDASALALLKQTDQPNNVLVRSAQPSWIHPINCIEWLQFDFQNRRIPVLERPTEFISYILRSADKKKLMIIYYTRNEDGIGRLGPLSAKVEAAKADGWQVQASFHPHNFHPDQPAMNGILAPSGPDSQLYKVHAASLGLEEAWITNGLHTFRMAASDFDKLTDIENPTF